MARFLDSRMALAAWSVYSITSSHPSQVPIALLQPEASARVQRASLLESEKDHGNIGLVEAQWRETECLGEQQEDMLNDLVAITDNWEVTNERRSLLIEKMVERDITGEEQLELDHLQSLADERIRLVAPRPIDALMAFEEDLKRRGLWID